MKRSKAKSVEKIWFKRAGLFAFTCFVTFLPLSAIAQTPDSLDVQSGGSSTAPAAGTSQPGVTTFEPEVPIPGQFTGSQTVDNDLFGRYVRAVYVYFIWTVGVLATVMVIFAGVKWVAAAGDQARIRDAREMINNAIIGVIIGLTSVVLLNLLSPGFTTLSIPGVATNVKGQYYEGVPILRVCDPNRDQTETFACGDVKKIGTQEANGKTVDTYCIATKCEKEEICILGKTDSSGYLKRSIGCSPQVTIANPAGEFADYTVIPVNQNRLVGPACGVIQKSPTLAGGNPYSVGFRCSNFTNNGVCYMVGEKATIQDNATIDSVQNIKCP